MRVNFTIEVPEAGVQRAPALHAFFSAALAGAGAGTKPSPPWPQDRIECNPPRGSNSPSLLDLAWRSTPAARGAYIDHGSLRVPRGAERDFRAAARYLGQDSIMRQVFERVEHSRTEYTLHVVHNGDDYYDPNSHTIAWDPHSALRTTSGGRQSPALGLGHELAHAAERSSRYDVHCDVRLRGYDNAEERRVIRGAEAHAARTLGEAGRFDHRGTCYRVATPLSM